MQVVWEDLRHHMETREGFGLLERLDWYRSFLEAQNAILEGRPPGTTRDIRARLNDLYEAQRRARRRSQPHPLMAGENTPPPGPSRPSTSRRVTASSSSGDADRPYDNLPPTMDSEPPILSPLSPTFASSSSRTISSSQTADAVDDHYGDQPTPLIHWSQNVFDGSNPITPYPPASAEEERSVCHGEPDASAPQMLVRDGFQRALQISFNEDRMWVRLYWRPTDLRCRVLIIARDARGQLQHYCTPLTNLKIIRQGPCLQLCRVTRGDHRYVLWARLSFVLHERMVLFYCTLVAMKRQDQQFLPEVADEFELDRGPAAEEVLFAGQMKHGNMYHALRLWRDRGSGVIRLEAAAVRGPKKDVPIWTAFLTRNAWDPDHVHFEGRGIVSLISLHPHPYVFVSMYEPPRKPSGDWILPFTSNDGMTAK